MSENRQGTEIAVEVPQEETFLKYTRSAILASAGLVSLGYPPSEKFAARAVSPTMKTTSTGLSEGVRWEARGRIASSPILR